MATLDTTQPQQQPAPGVGRRVSATLFRHPNLKLAGSLGPPLLWMLIVYLMAIGLMVASSFWRVDALTSSVVRDWGLQNYRTIIEDPTYLKITLRTLGMAVAVTVTDLALAFPIAYFIARMAAPRTRALLSLLVVIPLWANYLVRVFAWKTMLAGNGPLDAFLGAIGLDSIVLSNTRWAVWITFCYLWLPFAILPIMAALERVPDSYLEASGDLGAHAGMTFRKVVLPLALPGVVAASIFTFSLTLGDYLTPPLVGKDIFLGNAIDSLAGVANNRPLAAAIAVIPMVIVAIYLWIAKRLGAFEAL